MAHQSGVAPVVVLNKADVCAEVETWIAQIESVALHAPVHALSARTGLGLAALDRFLRVGQTIALLGSSGVGKSTIVNRVLGFERQRVRVVREGDHRGRHTTTRGELISLPSGANLVATPGLREIQLWADESAVSGTFEDIETENWRRRCATTPDVRIKASESPSNESGSRFTRPATAEQARPEASASMNQSDVVSRRGRTIMGVKLRRTLSNTSRQLQRDMVTLRPPGRVLLLSCYELGHPPHGIASPLAFLERAGFAPEVLDLSVGDFEADKVARAKFVGISVPMHTALRIAVRVAARCREINPHAAICFYGLYALLNSTYLLENGVDYCIGGEYEESLRLLIEALERGGDERVPGVATRGAPAEPVLAKLGFCVPSRRHLPPADRYAQLEANGERRAAGYTEASRGCRHLCTHCPIPPVYGGRFFVIPRDVVLEDIQRQVEAGARHITFGDPDFLNGPKHSLRIVRDMNELFPDLTFDFTAKVEHLIRRRESLREFADRGALFVVSAVESLNDRILRILKKGHSRADVLEAVATTRDAGIALRPTWVAFTPWTAWTDYQEILRFVAENDLIDHVDPIQYAIRLLVPPGSLLADHREFIPFRGPLVRAELSYRWVHPDPRMDRLAAEVRGLVEEGAPADAHATFDRVWAAALEREPMPARTRFARPRPPRLTESWFC